MKRKEMIPEEETNFNSNCNVSEIWLRRWCALEVRLQHLYDEIEAKDDVDKESFRTLVKSLHHFGRKHFYFFFNGFRNSELAGNLGVKCGDFNSFDKGSKLSLQIGTVTPSTYATTTASPYTDPASGNVMLSTIGLVQSAVSKCDVVKDLMSKEWDQVESPRQFIDRFSGVSTCETSSITTLGGLFNWLDANNLLSDYAISKMPPAWQISADLWQAGRNRGDSLSAMSDTDIGYRIEPDCDDPLCRDSVVDEIAYDFNDLQLECCKEFPPAYILGVIIDQISTDISVIERSWHQRTQSTAIPEIATLIKAQLLAGQAFSLAKRANLICDVTPIVFFGNQPSIRIIPYSNVALIAIPYTAIKTKIDHYMIAHEIGHWVFWNSEVRTPKDEVKMLWSYVYDDLLPGASDWSKNWREEIFADVFGSLVGGPLSLSPDVVLHSDELPSKMDLDDGIYPPPIVREATVRKVWPLMGMDPENADEVLDGVKSFPTYSELVENGKKGAAQIPLDAAYSEIQNTVEQFLDLLDGPIIKANPTEIPWSHTSTSRNVDTLVGIFEGIVDSLPESRMPVSSVVQFQDTWADVLFGELISDGGAPDVIKFDEWKHVFIANGWGTEGPEPPKWGG